MLKDTVLTLLFWVGLIAIPGCFRCDCPDSKPFVDINGLYSRVVKKSVSSSTPVAVKAGDKLSQDELVFLYADYQVRYYANQLPAKSASPHWGSAAYACKCSEEYGNAGTTEKLKFMTVRTVHDFDTAHPANSVVNELIGFITYPDPYSARRLFSERLHTVQRSRASICCDQSPCQRRLICARHNDRIG